MGLTAALPVSVSSYRHIFVVLVLSSYTYDLKLNTEIEIKLLTVL